MEEYAESEGEREREGRGANEDYRKSGGYKMQGRKFRCWKFYMMVIYPKFPMH